MEYQFTDFRYVVGNAKPALAPNEGAFPNNPTGPPEETEGWNVYKIIPVPAMSTPTTLSKERLKELQALRDHVRESKKVAMAGKTGQSVVNFLRVDALLDEGDELQQAYMGYQDQVKEAFRRLLNPPEMIAHLDEAERIRAKAHNMYVKLAAQRLGIDLTA